MNKLVGYGLILIAIVFGSFGLLNLLAVASVLLDGQMDPVYLIKRAAIIFITGFFMLRAFRSGKQKAFVK